ncbi:MAG: class B sortase [Clostridiales bacterium]|nr:class B sortase [Candidatus Cacconaster stercorequi]
MLLVIAFCAWKIWSIPSEYKKGNDTYEEAASFVSIPDKGELVSEEFLPEMIPNPPSDSDDDPAIELAEEDEIDWPVVDFNALREINPDIVGWIYIEDTNINYPIAQGPDNSYYLSRMYNKQWDGCGCIFMDYLNSPDFSDSNSVIYGHHMKNGSMFHDLDGYKGQEFYETHKTAYLLTPDKNYQIILFAGYVASLKDDA